MRASIGAICCAAVVLATSCPLEAAGPDQPALPAGHLTVHEWGTFLSMQGSDGVMLGGMVDSDEVLPPFVRERVLRGLSRATMYQKMETPVTYFYPDRPMTVDVRVDMHHGMLTHWFPAVNYFEPTVAQHKAAKKPIDDSVLYWRGVQLLPEHGKTGRQVALPAVAKDSIWRFARQTDAAVVQLNHGSSIKPRYTYEKFLFYRGLGKFHLPLEVHSTGTGTAAQLTLRNTGKEPLPPTFVIRIQHGTVSFAGLPAMPAGSRREFSLASLNHPVPLERGVSQVKQAVAAGLVQAGLYPKEALAMVNTWERSYFLTEGLRVLYLLPRKTLDAVLPIAILPAPERLVRVMVGRVEVLTPEKERTLEKAVANLAASSPVVRKAAQAELARLGRFQEPALHRVAEASKSAEVRARAAQMLKDLPDPR